eukprot:366107-Chlamydomonas_euryale.AAC.3
MRCYPGETRRKDVGFPMWELNRDGRPNSGPAELSVCSCQVPNLDHFKTSRRTDSLDGTVGWSLSGMASDAGRRLPGAAAVVLHAAPRRVSAMGVVPAAIRPPPNPRRAPTRTTTSHQNREATRQKADARGSFPCILPDTIPPPAPSRTREAMQWHNLCVYMLHNCSKLQELIRHGIRLHVGRQRHPSPGAEAAGIDSTRLQVATCCNLPTLLSHSSYQPDSVAAFRSDLLRICSHPFLKPHHGEPCGSATYESTFKGCRGCRLNSWSQALSAWQISMGFRGILGGAFHSDSDCGVPCAMVANVAACMLHMKHVRA